MLALQGYYDGQRIQTLETIQAEVCYLNMQTLNYGIKRRRHGKRRWQNKNLILGGCSESGSFLMLWGY